MTESGNKIQEITDKKYLTVNSGHGAEIVKGLDLGNIPYFAKFDESVIYLTFSSEHKNAVDEIEEMPEEMPVEEAPMEEAAPAEEEPLPPLSL